MNENENPEYVSYPIVEYKGNPLIEALNSLPEDDRESVRRLMRIPYFNPEERLLDARFRKAMPQRLKSFYFPRGQDVRMMDKITQQIFSGYVLRNPLSVDGQRRLYGIAVVDGKMRYTLESPIHRQASIAVVTGPSGIGKTVSISAIMHAIGKQVIRHSAYGERPFTETQIVYLKRNVPDQCSAKALCSILAEEIDAILGVDLYGKMFRNRGMNRTDSVCLLRRILISHHVGCIILDDFQNLSQAKSEGKEELLSLFLNLREELGIPMILIGTYEAASLLTGNASIARRLAEGGFHDLELPAHREDADWFDFCRVVWGYQWVRNPITLTQEIASVLYDFSQGITAIMLQLCIDAQVNAITSGRETIDPVEIKKAYDCSKAIKGIVTALRTGNKTVYEDLYLTLSRKNGTQDRSRRSQLEEQVQEQVLKSRQNMQRMAKSSCEEKPSSQKARKQSKRPEAVDKALKDIGSLDGSSLSDFIKDKK